MGQFKQYVKQQQLRQEIDQHLSDGVATYPLAGGRGEMSKVRLPKGKTRGSLHQHFSRKMLEKPKRGL